MSPYFTRHCAVEPACISLALAFPPSQGYKGGATTVEDLSKHGLFRGHLGLTPDKRHAVSLLVSRNLENLSTGKGNASERRLRESR